jgi:transposase
MAKEHRTFAMTHQELGQLKGWLTAEGCKVAGMEATGIHWKPVHHMLEGSMKVIVGNAAHMKGLKGRKTDKIDAEWIARKVRDDEIIPSFIPAEPARELRDLYRLRCSIVRNRTQIRLAIQKMLHAAGVPLVNVLNDLFGISGMGILNALADGEQTWDCLDALVKGTARKNLPAMRMALEVPLTPVQQWELKFQLERHARMEEDIAKVDREMELRLEPHETLRLALMTTPGIGREAAGFILAELGTDLTEFPDSDHFAAWTGTVPGNNQTGGVAKPAKARKGNRQIRSLLVECAHAASRTRGCWLRDKALALQKRMPYKKAMVAIAHKLACIIYHIIKDGAVYKDQREAFLPGKAKTKALAKAIKLTQAKGLSVVLPEAFPEVKVRPRGRPRKQPVEPETAPPKMAPAMKTRSKSPHQEQTTGPKPTPPSA